MLVNPFYYECVSTVSSSIDIIQMNCIIFEGHITTLKRNYCSIFSALGDGVSLSLPKTQKKSVTLYTKDYMV